jgi:hypothetical protein
MVENCLRLGLVAEIGDEPAAWRRVGELGLVEKYIPCSLPVFHRSSRSQTGIQIP